MIFEGQPYDVQAGENVLNCLLRHQVDIEYSCKIGHCQSCLVKLIDGELDSNAQYGLKNTSIEEGLFFACQQNAETVQKAVAIDSDLRFSQARLVDKHFYTPDICRLIIEPPNPLYYHAGQFINLKNPQGIIRSYSIASMPSEDLFIEFHVRRKSGGVMSSWLFEELAVGDSMDFQDPVGQCFYTSETGSNPMILIGTGTGAAPLLGILRDALVSDHKGEIKFYHGVATVQDLYLDYLLRALQRQHSNFQYHPCISTPLCTNSEKRFREGYCNDIALEEMTVSADTTLYICGNPEMVKQSQRRAFLAGIASKNINIDAFDYKDLRKLPR